MLYHTDHTATSMFYIYFYFDTVTNNKRRWIFFVVAFFVFSVFSP